MSTHDAPHPKANAGLRLLRPILLSPFFQRTVFALILSLVIALLMIDYVRLPGAGLQVGDIAERDVIATQSFELPDDVATRARRAQASRAVHAVFEQDTQASKAVLTRLHAAFELGRARLLSPESDPATTGTDGAAAGTEPESTRNKGGETGETPRPATPAPAIATSPAPVTGSSTTSSSDSNSAALNNNPVGAGAGASASKAPTSTSSDPVLQDALVQSLMPSRPAIGDALGVELPPALFGRVVQLRFDQVIEDALSSLITETMNGPILVDMSIVSDPLLVNGISLIKVDESTRQETVLYLRDGLLDLAAARKGLSARAAISLAGRPSWQISAISELGGRLLQPTLTFNESLTEQRRREAAEAVPAVKISVKKGTMIVRRGDPIDEHKFFLLQSIAELKADYDVGAMFFSVSLMVFVLLGTCYAFAATYIRKFAATGQDLLTVSLLLVIVVALTRASVEVGNALASYIPFIPLGAYYYAIPLATGAMVVRILMNSETALLFSMVMSVLAAMLLEYNGFYLAYYFVSSLAAAGGIAHTKERVHVLRGGLVAGVVNLLMVLAIHLVRTNMVDAQSHQGSEALALELAFAFCGGVVASIVTLGIVPFFEMFGYVTDYKLLELANLNHPLLKDLMLKAPGTYHHSVIVGNLSEAAAQAIRANALLARVGCLYHDIGKMKKSEFFIENLRNVSENRHDHMPAHMSALIIASHVRDGIEMARQHRLPQAIIDLIPGHHGTSLISYFYNKARQEAGSGEMVNENDFRYPGPRPRSREAGIVMLADATEASTRSIKNVNVSKIRINLQKIFQRVISDGQLDECPLTLSELARIMESFQKTLEAIYHNRIEYPPDVRTGAAMAGIGTGAVMSLESDSLTSGPVPHAVLQESNRKVARTTDLMASTTVDSMPVIPVSQRETQPVTPEVVEAVREAVRQRSEGESGSSSRLPAHGVGAGSYAVAREKAGSGALSLPPVSMSRRGSAALEAEITADPIPNPAYQPPDTAAGSAAAHDVPPNRAASVPSEAGPASASPESPARKGPSVSGAS